ncbi:MAG: hypothetical protein K6D94_05210 [Clostridiales bacterium]|nr:hypothetical protein [Clostridiales bacterium]
MASSRKKWPFLLLLSAVGALCGVAAARYFAEAAGSGMPLGGYLLRVAGMALAVYAGFFIHTVLHEGGHLIFGLLTGYGFVSFRVGSFVIMSGGGKLRTARYTVAGTAGQCLLSPPKRKPDGGYPYIAYNLGGIAVNVILAVISLVPAVILGGRTFMGAVMTVFAVIGSGTALTNGLPFLGVDNDGRNTLALIRSAAAREAFYVQLETVARMARGGRLRDIPEEKLEGEYDLSNGITAVIPVLRAERMLDLGGTRGTLEALEALFTDGRLADSMRGPVVCDLIFCRLIEGRDDHAQPDKAGKSYMNAMRTSPQVLRTEYALALLRDKDKNKAAETGKKLEAALRSHPYPGEIASERELVRLADTAAAKAETAKAESTGPAREETSGRADEP